MRSQKIKKVQFAKKIHQPLNVIIYRKEFIITLSHLKNPKVILCPVIFVTKRVSSVYVHTVTIDYWSV